MTGLRVAVLSPIAWRTPPRHYGPWEQFASLLTEGLVAAGHRVTLFATADSITAASLHPTEPRGQPDRNPAVGLVRGRDDRRQGRRVPAHRLGVRARRRVRHHPQRVRLPATHVQRSGDHAGGHPHPTGSLPCGFFPSTIVTTAAPPTCGSATPIDPRICSTPPPSITASMS